MKHNNEYDDDDIEDNEREDDFNDEEEVIQPTRKETKFDENSIMGKIKALLDKANNPAATENEKEQAVILAQKLLMKHNLDVTRVMSREESVKQGVEEDLVGYDEMWQAYLCHYICQNNFCRMIMKGNDRKLAVIGRPQNVSAVLYMFEFYRGAIMGLALKRYDEFLKMDEEDSEGGGKFKIKRKESHKTNFLNSYIKGCVEGVKDKMEKQKAQDVELGGEVTSLMVINEDLVDKYIRKNYPNLTSCGYGYGGNSRSAAYNSGHNDGGGIGSRADSGGGRQKLIG